MKCPDPLVKNADETGWALAGKQLTAQLVKPDPAEYRRTIPLPDPIIALARPGVGTESGGTYSLSEYREDLEASGFSSVRQVREDPWMDAVIQASRG